MCWQHAITRKYLILATGTHLKIPKNTYVFRIVPTFVTHHKNVLQISESTCLKSKLIVLSSQNSALMRGEYKHHQIISQMRLITNG